MDFPYPGSLSPNNGVRIDPDGKVLTVFGNAGIYVWHLADLSSPPLILKEETGTVDRMEFSRDGKTLATVGSDGVILWDIANRRQIGKNTLSGHTGRIADIAFTKDNFSVVYLDADGSVFKLILADPNKPPKNIKFSKTVRNPCRMTLSPDGNRFVYKSGTKSSIWDVISGTSLAEWEDNISCSGAITFSENGKTLAYNENNRVYVYTFGEAGEAPVELNGGQLFNFVKNLTFVLDDKILAVTADDGRIFFWDVGGHALLGTLNQSGQVKRVANGKLQIYIPSENRLLLMDFTPVVWQRLLEQWRTDLCAKVGRNLTQTEFQQYLSDRDFQDYKGTCSQWPVESVSAP